MGKGLLTLCLTTALGASVFGGNPHTLNEILTSSTNTSVIISTNGTTASGTKEYALKEGYKIQVRASKYVPNSASSVESRRLEYLITSKDTNTVINMVDNGADGLSLSDSMNLTHHFASGHNLFLKAEYPKKYTLRVCAEVYLNDKLVSKETRDTSKMLNIPILKQLFVDPMLIGPEINKRFEDGNEIYFGCVNDLIAQKAPNDFPCKEIYDVFVYLDGKIVKSRESKIANISLDGFSDRLSKGFNDLIEKNKQKNENQNHELAKKD